MDRVSGSHSLSSPDAGIVFRSPQIKRNYFRNDSLQKSARIVCRPDRARSIYAGKHFSECERACDQIVSPLFHPRVDGTDAFSELRIVFEPINKEHRIPVDSAHVFSFSA